MKTEITRMSATMLQRIAQDYRELRIFPRRLTPLTIAVILWFIAPAGLAQSELENILRSSDNFDEIVATGEAYFRSKHPGVPFKALTTGSERDGKFVKFMRWRQFWKHSLNPDGTLGDISAYGRNRQAREQRRSSDLYGSVQWTNISYEDYIVQQIGLGRTTSIAFHPSNANIFYVGAAIGGIWKTSDGGQSYTPLGDKLPFLAVSSIVVNRDSPEVLYISVSDHLPNGPPGIGVYKSVNDGATWLPTALSFDFADNVRIYWMEADPEDATKIFVATSDGLYRTDDGFISVAKINNISTFDVKINPGNSSIIYQGGTDGTFYRSTNGGSSFGLVRNFGGGNVYTATTPLNSAKIYVRNDNTLYSSTNSGASFSATTYDLPEPNYKEDALVVSHSNENILMSGYFDIHRSDNSGASFTAVSHWRGANSLPLVHVDQRNVFTNPLQPDFIYFCNDGGVYRYSVSSESFENLSNGLMITQFYDIAVAQTDDQVISGGSQDNGNVFRNSNGVWEAFAPTGDGMNQEIDPTDADIRYWAFQFGELLRWDSGVNTPIYPIDPPNGAWETPFRLDPVDSNRLIAGYSTVYESLNRGGTWSDIGGATDFGGNLEEIAISKSNPNRIYAARANQLFVKSVAGNSWTAKTMPDSISDLEVAPVNQDIVYISVPGFASGNKVYQSLDAGSSWVNISGSLPNISVGAIEIYENAPDGLFIGTDVGVFYRDDTLPDWQLYGDLPNTRVEDIEIQYASGLIRAGTHGRGVLEAPIVITPCEPGAPDADNDGVCDHYDACPTLNNNLIGMPCDDGDLTTTGELYDSNCDCTGGLPTASYCAAAGMAGTTGDWIKRVEVNTLKNISGKSAYSNFRDQSTTLAAAGAYPLTVELETSFPLDKIYAWVDNNRDGNFAPSEQIVMSALDNKHRSVGMIDVPANIGFSPTVMRVRSIYADPNLPNPCDDFFGEVEDYTLRFEYCQASGDFGTGSDWIKNVTLNTMNNDSAQTYYSDFRHVSTNLDLGQTYPIEVTLQYGFAIDAAHAWIDFDQDGYFEESERTSFSSFPVGPDSTARGTINVPDNALSGRTVMRVRVIYDNTDPTNPCGGYFGEVEDYTVIFAADNSVFEDDFEPVLPF